MKFQAIALSDVGRHRKNNEDNLYFKQSWRDPKETGRSYRATMEGEGRRTLFAIGDGMGGEALGEQASYMAVSGLKVLEDRFNNVSGQAFPKLMDHYIQKTNESICLHIKRNGGLRMGSTFTCLLLGHHVAQVINIGDSMAYLYRDETSYPLTRKHSHVQRLLEMGIITEDEALTHPDRHRLTQHLGLFAEEKQLEPSVSPEIWMKTGDIYMLCSDGITEMLTMQQIEAEFKAGGSIAEIGDRILTAALDAGGKDNASLILISILEARPIQTELHPNAVSEPPFELETISHSVRQEDAVLEHIVAPKSDDMEDADVKKSAENKHPEQDLGAMHTESPDLLPDGLRAPVPPVAPVAPTMSAQPAAAGPEQQAGSPQMRRAFELSADDEERFRRAQAEAASRQQARRVSSAPIKVSSAYEEEQMLQRRQLQQGRQKPGVNWRGVLRHLIFFLVFIGIGYAAAWLFVNFGSIRSFFRNLL